MLFTNPPVKVLSGETAQTDGPDDVHPLVGQPLWQARVEFLNTINNDPQIKLWAEVEMQMPLYQKLDTSGMGFEHWFRDERSVELRSALFECLSDNGYEDEWVTAAAAYTLHVWNVDRDSRAAKTIFLPAVANATIVEGVPPPFRFQPSLEWRPSPGESQNRKNAGESARQFDKRMQEEFTEYRQSYFNTCKTLCPSLMARGSRNSTEIYLALARYQAAVYLRGEPAPALSRRIYRTSKLLGIRLRSSRHRDSISDVRRRNEICGILKTERRWD